MVFEQDLVKDYVLYAVVMKSGIKFYSRMLQHMAYSNGMLSQEVLDTLAAQCVHEMTEQCY